ncbi:MAG: phosphomethylpyrimidine synthase ThiC [Candidatus Omnitrophica bacterium]|nr:phosphomethylpyrimidine synthase ThiC [Candidatus Omnitrophota bacterium]
MINVNETLLSETAKYEDRDSAYIKEGVEAGYIVIPKNKNREVSKPCAIGRGLTVKVNANIGLSTECSTISDEMKKMEVAVSAGADAVMDLSTGEKLEELRLKILAECPVPVGTVPVYELACIKDKNFLSMKENDFVEVIRKQAEEGVDFFTIHSGITMDVMSIVERDQRIMNIVSRGGALLGSWMVKNHRENPFFSRFDDILEICKEHDVTLSLGDSLRPGTIFDATDRLQIEELLILGDLQKRALAKGVQVMIEGPGHVPLDQIEANVKLQKSVCNGAPFYVLGPLVTDAAPGYDHITGAIGGAIAAWHGADFLCYVTPAEHIRLPDAEDVHRGVIASKIAAHAADIVKKIPAALKTDRDISEARAKRDWKKQFALSIDPGTAARMRKQAEPLERDVCTMCSEYCSIKVTEESLKAASRTGKT